MFFVHFLLCNPFFCELSLQFIIDSFLSIFLYHLITLFHFDSYFFKCWNAIFVKLRIFVILPEHGWRIDFCFIKFFTLLGPLLLLSFLLDFFFFLSFSYQDVSRFKVPYWWLSHLSIWKSDSKIYHGIVSKIITNFQDFVWIRFTILSDFISKFSHTIQQIFLIGTGNFIPVFIVHPHHVEWMD